MNAPVRAPAARWRIYASLPQNLRERLSRFGLTRRLKERSLEIAPRQVHAVLDAFTSHGVPVWLAGGWGVDALAGGQTRSHHDLDLVVELADRTVAAEVLTSIGFELHAEIDVAGAGLPLSMIYRDRHGHRVDVHPIRIGDASPPESSVPGRPALSRNRLGSGWIDGRSVPCVTAEAQFALHEGYEPRPEDLRDLATLRVLRDRALQAREPLGTVGS